MVLIVGGTGFLGGAIAQGLRSKGEKVRALVRSTSQTKALESAGVELVRGDMKDAASLDAACSGVDVVITTANSVLRSGADTIESVDVKGNQSLIDAAKKAKVKHFIFTSALGADPNSPVPFMKAKAATEQYLKQSGLTYTILSPNFFMDFWVATVVGGPAAAGKPVTIVGEGKRRHSFVALKDVAAFAIEAIKNPAARNQQIVIGGPSPVTWHEVVAAFQKVLGRPIQVNTVKPGTPLPGVPDMVAGLLAALDSFDSPIDMTATAKTYGIPLTSLEQFASAARA